ncbi:MAG TPA: HAD hydrolase-like protein [Gemmatimonadaceae bacterium]|nr:HAD hydrolase-like protein [Gemmatimonadaceae bacterium]
MPYRLAIFDFDGTLADSIAIVLAAMNEAAARWGFERVDAERLRELRRLGPLEIAERIRFPMWKSPVIARFIRRRVAEQHEQLRLFPGVPEMLDGVLARGVTVAIVSSNAEATVRRVLGAPLAGRVAYYGCGGSVLGKRRFLRQALARTGVPFAQAIKIGDEIRDLEAARAERIAFGGVAWGYAEPDALRARGADHLFERVEEIAAVVGGQGAG